VEGRGDRKREMEREPTERERFMNARAYVVCMRKFAACMPTYTAQAKMYACVYTSLLHVCTCLSLALFLPRTLHAWAGVRSSSRLGETPKASCIDKHPECQFHVGKHSGNITARLLCVSLNKYMRCFPKVRPPVAPNLHTKSLLLSLAPQFSLPSIDRR